VDALARIRQAIGRHADGGLTRTPIPSVSVVQATAATVPHGDFSQPAFALVAGGRKRAALNGHAFRYRAGQYLISSVGVPMVGQVEMASAAEPYQAVVVELRRETIAELLLETGRLDRSRVAPAVGVGDAEPRLLDAAARLLELLDHPDDTAALRPGLEREVLWRLLQGPFASTIQQIGLADSHLSHLTRAIGEIRRRYDEPLPVHELAAIASMSVASFHRHFRALTTMSPLQFQKQIRLNEAHTRLLAHGADVSSVAHAVGYSSPSQFSREYRRAFGAPPSATRRSSAALVA
jgi:AraC-like DNA-binding protein